MKWRLLFSTLLASPLLSHAVEATPKSPASKSPIGVQNAKSLRILDTAISFTVNDVAASSRFLMTHFGFREKIGAPGFSSLVRDDSGVNVIFLKRGIPTLPKEMRATRAAGVILAFVVADVGAQEARLRREKVKITLPLRTDPWGERLFQVTDPNGVVIELVQWLKPVSK